MAKLDGSEQVLCVPSADVSRALGTRGRFAVEEAGYALPTLLRHAEFRPRTEALEADEAWRQVIPYGVVTRAGRVLVYRRTKSGGEPRLHRRLSIGVGGHVNPEDWPQEPSLYAEKAALDAEAVGNALDREIREEIRPAGQYRATLAGFLVLYDTPVDRVHMGVVYRVELAGDDIVPSDDLEIVGWMGEKWLARSGESEPERWEWWSRVLLEASVGSPKLTEDLLLIPPVGSEPTT